MSTIPEPLTPGTARMREEELREELVEINRELSQRPIGHLEDKARLNVFNFVPEAHKLHRTCTYLLDSVGIGRIFASLSIVEKT